MNLSNENVIHFKDGDVEYLQFRELLKYSDKIQHAYSLKPLKFSDNNEEASENYRKICKSLKIDSNKIIKSTQKHTDVVQNITEFTDEEFEFVDGFVTNKTEIPLVTKYADCTPIIFYDKIKNVIGNVHSGWRGTLKKISQKAVIMMKEKYGCNPEDIIVCIGPCIKQCHFEVEEDFIQKFKEEFGNIEKYYKKGKTTKNENIEEYHKKSKNLKNENSEEKLNSNLENEKVVEKQKYYFDTTKLIIDYLMEIGIEKENIFDSNICSVCNSNEMHSYRAEKELADRNMNIIELL